MGGKRGEAASYNIPSDLCEEILSRLPSNDLLNFKRVCKDWKRLISTKAFIQKHLQRSKADCNNIRFLVELTLTVEIIDCASNTSKQISSVYCHILGSCDGLVLYSDSFSSKIAAFNPCTGESLLLVSLSKQFGLKLGRNTLQFSWFGHHPVTAQYVLLVVYWESGIITFQLYSLSLDRNNINTINSLPLISSSTLELGTELPFLRYGSQFGTLLHGRLHSPVILFNRPEFSHESIIIVYDFETNKITRMTYSDPKYPVWMLRVVDGCLCAVQNKQVWMMKEYGVEQSWTIYAKIDKFPFAVSPDGDVLIRSDDGFTISKYRLREREAKIVSKFHLKMALRECIATACIDSLVSPTLLCFGVGGKRNE